MDDLEEEPRILIKDGTDYNFENVKGMKLLG